MKKSHLLLPLMSALFAQSGMASSFDYNNFDLAYFGGTGEPNSEFWNIDGRDLGDLDLAGFSAAIRFEMAEGFVAYFGYQKSEITLSDNASRLLVFSETGIDELDIWSLSAGLGAYVSPADCLDFYYGAAFTFNDYEVNTSEGEFGTHSGVVSLQVGGRWSPVPWLEVNPSVTHSIMVDDGDLGVEGTLDTTSAGLNLYVTTLDYIRPFLGVEHQLSGGELEDATIYSAGLRVVF